LLTVSLPIVLFGVVLICGISAEVLHSRQTPQNAVGLSMAAAAPSTNFTAKPADLASRPQPQRQAAGPAPDDLPPPDFVGDDPEVAQELWSRLSPEERDVFRKMQAMNQQPIGSMELPSGIPMPIERLESATPQTDRSTSDELEMVAVDVPLDPEDPPAPAIPDRPLTVHRAFTSDLIVSFSKDLEEAVMLKDSQLIYSEAGKPSATQTYDMNGLEITTADLGIDISAGTADGKVLWFDDDFDGGTQETLQSHSDRVLATSTGVLKVWSCSADGTLIKNTRSRRNGLCYRLPAKPLSCRFASWQAVAIGLEDRRVLIGRGTDYKDWSGFRSLTPPHSIAWSGNCDFVLVATTSQIEIRDAKTFELIQFFAAPTPLTAAALSQYGRLLAFCGRDGKLVLCSTYSRRVLATHQLSSPAVQIRFSFIDEWLTNVATADGEILRVEFDERNLEQVEMVPRLWQPLASRGQAAQWTPMSAFLTPEVETAFETAGQAVRDLVLASGRSPARVQYLQRQDDQVVAFGCGLTHVKRVLWLHDGRQTELPVAKSWDGQVWLDWRPPDDVAPLLLFELEDALVATVPFDLAVAEPQSVSRDRDDESMILWSGRTFETLDDRFRVLVLSDRTAITDEIKGRGVVIAQSGALLPQKFRGAFTVVRTNGHQTPAGFPGAGQTDLSAENLYVCPVPPVLTARE
jgi:hypothetical protein